MNKCAGEKKGWLSKFKCDLIILSKGFSSKIKVVNERFYFDHACVIHGIYVFIQSCSVKFRKSNYNVIIHICIKYAY